MLASETDSLFQRAMSAQAAGDRQGAIVCFRQILAVEPNHLDAVYLLGTLHAESGDLNGGRVYLERASELAPDSPYILNNLGTVHRLLGNFDDALRAYRRAFAIAPHFIDAQCNLGAMLTRVGDADEAVRLLETVVRERPDWDIGYFNLGSALRRVDAARAVPCFERAVALRPNNPKYLEALAMTCFSAGFVDDARRYARTYRASHLGLDSEIPLLLARIDNAVIPGRYPRSAIIETYRRKAGCWEENIRKAGMEFFGPTLVESAVLELGLAERSAAILDIGCGTGLCASFLRPLAGRLVGVDLSPDMLARAAGRYDETHCLDLMQYLELGGAGEFDLIVASGVLVLFGDLAPVLSAASTRLAAGGTFVFTLYRSSGDAVEVRQDLYFAHSREHIERRCGEAGLAVLALNEVVHEMHSGLPQPGWVVTARRVDSVA